MDQLLNKLGINGNQSPEEILHELEKKQMELLDRLDSVTDEARREELSADLKELEGAIGSLSWMVKRQESGIARDEADTGAIGRDEETSDGPDAGVTAGETASFGGGEQEALSGELLSEAINYKLGENGYEQDSQKAYEKALEAAKLGNARAQYLTATCYHHGDGTVKDIGKRNEWLEAAAKGGDVQAESWLGEIYLNGDGALVDYEKAAEWFLRAANQGNPSALNNLGYMYRNGYGVPESQEKAKEYYHKAVDAAEEGGYQEILDIAASNLLGLGDELWYGNFRLNRVRKQYEADQELLKEGGRLGKDQLSPEEMREKANRSTPLVLRYFGYGEMLQDEGKFLAALPLLQEAFEEGGYAAATNIGAIYMRGSETVPQNSSMAISWWQKGADKGVVACIENMGFVYHDGNGVPQDYQVAAHWLQKAADAGSGKSMFSLAWMYMEGAGVPKDPQNAYRLMRQAADAGETRAYNDLGTFYYQGMGTARDFDMAVTYFEKAYEAGDLNGKNNLEAIHMGNRAMIVEQRLKWKAQKEELREKANALAEELQGGDALEAKAKEYNGLGGSENEIMAELLREIAAERGNAEAQYLVGFNRLLQDYQDEGAADLIKKAAEQGNLEALCRVAEWHLGVGIHGCPGDKEKAIELLERAAAGGSITAKESLKKLKPFDGIGKKLSGLFGRK